LTAVKARLWQSARMNVLQCLKGNVQMRSILVPIDGSPHSLKGLAHVAERRAAGEKFDVDVVVVEAVEMYSDIPKKLPRGKDILANPEAEELIKSLNAKTRVLTGPDPAELICDHAKANGSSSIVMGTRGLGKVKALVLGSVSNKVVQLAEVPVTLVK